MNEKNLVIVAPYFEPKLWTQAVADGVLLLMSPGTSFSHVDLHEAIMDLAITVGTKVIPDADSAIKVVPDINDLGKAKLVVASVKETQITQIDEIDEDKLQVYDEYVNKLKTAIEAEDSELSQTVLESMKDRLARLSGGIATIHIGAPTPTEKEKKV